MDITELNYFDKKNELKKDIKIYMNKMYHLNKTEHINNIILIIVINNIYWHKIYKFVWFNNTDTNKYYYTNIIWYNETSMTFTNNDCIISQFSNIDNIIYHQ